MGSPDDEPERDSDEGPQHRVRLKAFLLGQTPVTQAQWAVVAGWPKVALDLDPTPSDFSWEGTNRPVERVNWHEAMEFCRRLSHATGEMYTLPSEAQWEYACRAGSTTPFAFGATLTPELANYNAAVDESGSPAFDPNGQTTDVGHFPANAWGLHDMHGNVWEWCLDCWHGSYEGAPIDGNPWQDSSDNTHWLIKSSEMQKWKLLRGGSWNDSPELCRSAFRSDGHPDIRSFSVGFRVCCLPQSA